MTTRKLRIYGAFNCPWSLLASQRASLLEAEGASIDWRAVEHEAGGRRTQRDELARFAALRREAERVLDHLLPDEQLAYALAGFATDTRAALVGYAAAHAAGAASTARRVLFDAFWRHSIDLADPWVVHTLLVDAVRSASPRGDPLRHWDYGTATPHRATASILRWTAQWQAIAGVLPAIVVDDSEMLRGSAAVDWLGGELSGRWPEPSRAACQPTPGPTVGQRRPAC